MTAAGAIHLCRGFKRCGNSLEMRRRRALNAESTTHLSASFFIRISVGKLRELVMLGRVCACVFCEEILHCFKSTTSLYDVQD